MKTRRRLLLLATKLKQFGLNPADWKIERRARDEYRIYQPWNEDFELVGRIDARNRWVNMEMKLLFAAI